MVIHNPILTGSFTVNNIDVSSITSSAANITALNATTASLNSFSASVLSYTASQNILNGTYTLTSSFNAQTASFTAFSASVLTFTGSAATRLGALEAATASLYTATSSLNASVASLNSYTQSTDAKIASIYSTTSSLNTRVGTLEAYTSSLNDKTSSFATTGSNTFIGSQVVSGSIVQSGSFTTTGTIIAQTINVQTVTSSIVYSSGSNIFGNLLGDSQKFTGSVLITGSLTIAGGSSATSYSGTTIYGSTAVCSAIGKFTTCLDLGGALTGTSAIFSSSVTSVGLLFNTGNYLGSRSLRAASDLLIFYGGTAGFNFTDSTNSTVLASINNSGVSTFGTTASTTYGTLNIVQQSVCSPSFVRGIELVHPNGTGVTGGYIGISMTGQKQGTIQVGDDSAVGNLLLQSQGGNVGIGTSSPGYRLEICGDGTGIGELAVKGSGTDIGLALNNTGTGGKSWRILSTGGGSGAGNGKLLTWDGTGYGWVIDCSRNMGIGTTSPNYANLVICNAAANSGNNSALTIGRATSLPSSAADYGNIFLFSTDAYAADKGGTISFGSQYGSSGGETRMSGIFGGKENATNGDYSGYLSFYTRLSGNQPAERMRITSAGIACFACQVCASSGVKFGNGSSTLNYYEEGTWTPRLKNGSFTTNAGAGNAGWYTRIGNLITVGGTLDWGAGSGAQDGNSLQIACLPFASSSTSNQRNVGQFGAPATSSIGFKCTTKGQFVLVNDPGASYIYLIETFQDGTYSTYSHNLCVANAGTIYGFQITYHI
jgi:hypothetical protein